MSARLPISISLALFALLAVAGCGGGGGATAATGGSTAQAPSSAATIDVSSSAGLGPILVDSQGRTLYLFQKDSNGGSRCSAACAQIWPPQLTKGNPKAGGGVDAAKLGTIKRSDGSMQVTYARHPLYAYTGDTGPGQARGNGLNAFGAVWNAVQPDGSQAAAGGGSASTSGGSYGGGYGY